MLNSFADASYTAERNISTAKTEVLHLSRNPDQFSLQVNEATLKQVQKFKYHGFAFTSDRTQDEELYTRIGKASAVMRALYYSAVMKRELSKKAKLSIFKTVFSLSHVWLGILGNDQKNTITIPGVRNDVFTKNRRSYTV